MRARYDVEAALQQLRAMDTREPLTAACDRLAHGLAAALETEFGRGHRTLVGDALVIVAASLGSLTKKSPVELSQETVNYAASLINIIALTGLHVRPGGSEEGNGK